MRCALRWTPVAPSWPRSASGEWCRALRWYLRQRSVCATYLRPPPPHTLRCRRYRALQQRRALEIEGFHTDVGQLRAAMRRVERQWALVNGVVADAALVDQVRLNPLPCFSLSSLCDDSRGVSAALLCRCKSSSVLTVTSRRAQQSPRGMLRPLAPWLLTLTSTTRRHLPCCLAARSPGRQLLRHPSPQPYGQPQRI